MELPDVVEKVLELSKGEEELEAYAVRRLSTTIQAGADSKIREVGRSETVGLGIRVIREGRLGYSSTSDLAWPTTKLTVQRARANAAASDVDDAQQLPTPQSTDSAPGLFDPSLSSTPLAEKIGLVDELSRRVVAIDRRVTMIDTAEYHDEDTTTAIASTRGLFVCQRIGHVGLWADALGEDAVGRASDYSYQLTRSLADCDIESIAAAAVQRTVRLLGPVCRHRGGLPIIFDPAVVGELLNAIGKGLSGGPVSSGRTPFADKEGASVGAPCVDLLDDGRSVASAAAAAYDDEGVPRRTTGLIDAGVLVGALHSTVTARATGSQTKSTGNARRTTHRSVPRAAPSCLVFEPTTSRPDLIAGVDQALYIQQLSGAGVGINAVNGRINVGGVGWLLRDGQVAGRTDVIPMTTNLLALLAAVRAVGDDSHPSPFWPARASTVLCEGQLLRADP